MIGTPKNGPKNGPLFLANPHVWFDGAYQCYGVHVLDTIYWVMKVKKSRQSNESWEVLGIYRVWELYIGF